MTYSMKNLKSDCNWLLMFCTGDCWWCRWWCSVMMEGAWRRREGERRRVLLLLLFQLNLPVRPEELLKPAIRSVAGYYRGEKTRLLFWYGIVIEGNSVYSVAVVLFCAGGRCSIDCCPVSAYDSAKKLLLVTIDWLRRRRLRKLVLCGCIVMTDSVADVKKERAVVTDYSHWLTIIEEVYSLIYYSILMMMMMICWLCEMKKENWHSLFWLITIHDYCIPGNDEWKNYANLLIIFYNDDWAIENMMKKTCGWLQCQLTGSVLLTDVRKTQPVKSYYSEKRNSWIQKYGKLFSIVEKGSICYYHWRLGGRPSVEKAVLFIDVLTFWRVKTDWKLLYGCRYWLLLLLCWSYWLLTKAEENWLLWRPQLWYWKYSKILRKVLAATDRLYRLFPLVVFCWLYRQFVHSAIREYDVIAILLLPLLYNCLLPFKWNIYDCVTLLLRASFGWSYSDDDDDDDIDDDDILMIIEEKFIC